MIMDGCHFTLGSFDSLDAGVIFVKIDTSEYLNSMATIGTSYVFNKKNKQRYVAEDVYSSSFISMDAEIASDNFEPFDRDRRRYIERSLFNKPNFRKLYVSQSEDLHGETWEFADGEIKRTYLMARFMNPSRIEDGSGRVIGYKFSVECNSPLMWQDPSSIEHSVSQNGGLFTVDVDTDLPGYTYPEVQIITGSTGGNITMINHTDSGSRITGFTDTSPISTIIMIGDVSYISESYYERFSNQNFVRFLQGENNFSVSGDISTVKMSWQNRRFL